MAGVDREFTAVNRMSEVESEIGIAIPAFRNPERLRRCLKSIARIDPTWLALTTVVDDSGDGSVAASLKSEFRSVTWIVHEKNVGFIGAANRAVQECHADIVLLLNDDVEVLSDSRARILDIFSDESLFAVSLRSVNKDGETREGAKRMRWRGGIAKILHNPRDQAILINGVSETAYAVGGHAAYRRKAFLELGGFDDRYNPFYWEDVDLSYRAKTRGFGLAYLDESAILHDDIGAIKASNEAAVIRKTTWRNRLLFSECYARGIQRALLPLGIAWYTIYARITHDKALSSAISEFQMVRRHQIR